MSKNYEYKTTYETCPFCGEEHRYKIGDGMVQKCKGCGESIVLCSICPNNYSGCEDCEYNKKAQEIQETEVKKLEKESKGKITIDCIVDQLFDDLPYANSEEKRFKAKKWLLEYQAANQLTLRELNEMCWEDSVWVFDQIFQ